MARQLPRQRTSDDPIEFPDHLSSTTENHHEEATTVGRAIATLDSMAFECSRVPDMQPGLLSLWCLWTIVYGYNRTQLANIVGPRLCCLAVGGVHAFMVLHGRLIPAAAAAASAAAAHCESCVARVARGARLIVALNQLVRHAEDAFFPMQLADLRLHRLASLPPYGATRARHVIKCN